MLKVLQLIPTLDRSGAEKQMVLLAKGLPRDRFRVEVATLTRLGPLEAELSAAGIPVTVDRQAVSKLDPIALARLARFLKAGSFDVVQTWIFAANTYGRVASRLAGVPVVVVAEMAVDLWKGRVERFVDRRLATWCDRLVGNSHAVVDFYRRLGVPDDRLAMIYSGIARRGAAGGRSGGGPRRVRIPGRCAAGPLRRPAGRAEAGRRPVEGARPAPARPARPPHLDRRRRPVARAARRDRARLSSRRPGPVPGPSRRRPAAAGRRRPARLAQRVRGLAQRGARGDAVSQAGRRHRRAGDDRGRRRRPDRAARPDRQRSSHLTRAIRDVVRDPALARRLGEAGRARVEAHFRADAMVAHFAELYEQPGAIEGDRGIMTERFCGRSVPVRSVERNSFRFAPTIAFLARSERKYGMNSVLRP